MTLEKAKLIAVYKDEGQDIEFMFNPNQLAFSRSISLEQAEGASTSKGNNKVSFKHPNPYSLKISNILIDTYETNYNYLRCFVKTFNFKLTLFRPDGTPVRASVDLDLEQVDLPNSQPGQSTPSPNYKQRQAQGREAFSS